MQLFSRRVSVLHSPRSNSDQKLLSRITIQAALLAAAIAIPIACYSVRSGGILMPSSDFGPPLPEMAGAYGGLEGQQALPIDLGRFKINVTAFNYQRKTRISLESAELLSLANALKLELARTPAGPPSPGTLQKIQKIEKLARQVKEQMRDNPVLGPI